MFFVVQLKKLLPASQEKFKIQFPGIFILVDNTKQKNLIFITLTSRTLVELCGPFCYII